MRNKNSMDSISYWYRKILNAYWIVLLVAVVAEIAALIVTVEVYPQYLRFYLIHISGIPTLLMLVIMLVNEAFYRYLRVEQPAVIIGTGVAFACILIAANPLVPCVKSILMLPMVIALFFFDRKILLLTLLANLTALGLLYTLNDALRFNTSLYDLLANVFILCGGYFVERGIVSRGVALVNHLTKTIQSEQELLVKTVVMDKLSKTDALTELYNHKTFHEYLDKLVEHNAESPFPLHLAVMDIDNFKTINDTWGHAVGDIVLRRVAQQISELISPSEIIARYGGEEFALIFTEKPLEEAFATVEKIRLAIHGIAHPEMDGRQVSVSIGLTSYVQGQSKSDLFAESDALLYTAKRCGKNQTKMQRKP
ncbi:GGDEF domain-containing protein [Paenibacillus athensensis]|nr:GGDEF domain-containing protein [Paenibacillus athensensis]MCD1259649.1 GGDEF domain-containing protein [Paenibacillus athensensis]